MPVKNVIEVFTNKSTEFMLDYGGSASWVLSLAKAAALEFCVCTRNDQLPREDDKGKRAEERNEAFLVGKISGFEFVERQNDRDRYMFKFSEYAEVSVGGFRDGTKRNPVAYSDVDSCVKRGLDLNRLGFKPVPESTRSYERAPQAASIAGKDGRGISIGEAKVGLSIYFDVPVDAINITISG